MVVVVAAAKRIMIVTSGLNENWLLVIMSRPTAVMLIERDKGETETQRETETERETEREREREREGERKADRHKDRQRQWERQRQ